ncbi:MAG: hypothetical protein JSV29_01000 [Candidatus Bathyarchaeota archaeon]|nr:MAG: hypothetical protein JSV29_01000 [Candidatus Bathyarchaeota archaeon]
MVASEGNETDEIIRCLKIHGPVTFRNFLTALLVWLFGVLVLIPIASSLGERTRLLCSLIIFAAFTAFMYRATFGFKKLIDAFSLLPARKYGSKLGLARDDALTVFRHSLYIIFILIIYLLYFPFLLSFHFAISGIALIIILIWILFLLLKILSLLSSKILGKLI